MANQLNYNHLHYFHTVATEGSLKAASARLHVTQPTISEQLRALEATLDQDLFDRSDGTLRLNEAGQSLYRDTEAMFAIGARISQRFLAAGVREERELLRVGISSDLSRAFSAAYLLPLMADDAIKVRVREGSHDRVFKAMIGWEMDLMLCSELPAKLSSKGITAKRLTSAPMVAVASPDRARQVGAFPEGLADQPFYAYLPGSRKSYDLEAFFMAQGIELSVHAETNDLGLMLAAARLGSCVAFVPRPSLEGAEDRAELVVIGELPAPEAAAYALFHTNKTPQRVTSAVDRLRG